MKKHKCNGVPCSICCGCGCKFRKHCKSCGHMMGHWQFTEWGPCGGCKACGEYVKRRGKKSWASGGNHVF